MHGRCYGMSGPRSCYCAFLACHADENQSRLERDGSRPPGDPSAVAQQRDTGFGGMVLCVGKPIRPFLLVLHRTGWAKRKIRSTLSVEIQAPTTVQRIIGILVVDQKTISFQCMEKPAIEMHGIQEGIQKQNANLRWYHGEANLSYGLTKETAKLNSNSFIEKDACGAWCTMR